MSVNYKYRISILAALCIVFAPGLIANNEFDSSTVESYQMTPDEELDSSTVESYQMTPDEMQEDALVQEYQDDPDEVALTMPDINPEEGFLEVADAGPALKKAIPESFKAEVDTDTVSVELPPLQTLLQKEHSTKFLKHSFPTAAKRVDLTRMTAAMKHYQTALHQVKLLIGKLEKLPQNQEASSVTLLEAASKWSRCGYRCLKKKAKEKANKAKKKAKKKANAVKQKAKDAANAAKNAARAAKKKAKKAKEKAKKIANAAKQKAKDAGNAVKNKAQAALQHAIELAKKLTSIVGIIKKLAKVLGNAIKTAACMSHQSGLLSIKKMLKSPKRYVKDFFSKLKGVFPKIMKHSVKRIGKTIITSHLSMQGGHIDLPMLVKALVADVKDVAKEEPLLGCFADRMERALEVTTPPPGKQATSTKSQNSQNFVQVRGITSGMKKAIGYMKNTVWDKALEPAFPKLVKFGLEMAEKQLAEKIAKLAEETDAVALTQEPKHARNSELPQVKSKRQAAVRKSSNAKKTVKYPEAAKAKKRSQLYQAAAAGIRSKYIQDWQGTAEEAGVHPLLTALRAEQHARHQQRKLTDEEFAQQMKHFEEAKQLSLEQLNAKFDMKSGFDKFYKWGQKKFPKAYSTYIKPFERCFDGMRVFTPEWNACIIQTAVDTFKVVDMMNTFMRDIFKSVFAGGVPEKLPCDFFNMETPPILNCRGYLKGTLNKLEGLDRISQIKKLEVLRAGVGPGRFGPKTTVLQVRLELEGMAGFNLDLSSEAGLKKKNEEVELQDQPEPAHNSTQLSPAETAKFAKLLKPGDKVIRSTLTRPGGLIQHLSVVHRAKDTTLTQWGSVGRSFNAAKNFVVKKLKEGVDFFKFCNKRKKIGVVVTTKSPGSVVIEAQLELKIDPKQIAENLLAAMDGDLQPDPKTYEIFTNMMFLMNMGKSIVKGEELSASSKDSVSYPAAVLMRALDIHGLFQFNEFSAELVEFDIDFPGGPDWFTKYVNNFKDAAFDATVKKLEGPIMDWMGKAIELIVGKTFDTLGFNRKGPQKKKKKKEKPKNVKDVIDIIKGFNMKALTVKLFNSALKAMRAGSGWIPTTMSKQADGMWSDILQKSRSIRRQSLVKVGFKGYEWFQKIKAPVMAAYNRLNDLGLIEVALQAFINAKTSAGKVSATKTLQNLMAGETSFSNLADSAMDAIQKAVKDALVDCVDANLPQWTQHLEQMTVGFMLKGASFVAEEVLSAPVPLSQWGMESLGSGIMEVLKMAWSYISQWGARKIAKLAHWVIDCAVRAIFFLPSKGASANGWLFDKTMLKIMHASVAGMKTGPAIVSKVLSMFPPSVRDRIRKHGQDIFKILLKRVSPEMAQKMKFARAVWMQVQQACLWSTKGSKDCQVQTPVMLQENLMTEKGISKQLQHAFDNLPRLKPDDIVTPWDQFEADKPGHPLDVLLQGQDEDIKAGSTSTLVEVMVTLHKEQKESSVDEEAAPTKHGIMALADLNTDALSNQLESIKAHLKDLEPSTSKADRAELLAHVNSAAVELQTGQKTLKASRWLKKLLSFFKTNAKMVLCLFKTGAGEVVRLARRFKQGGFKGLAKGVGRDLEAAIKGVIKTATGVFHTAVKHLSQNVKQSQGPTPQMFVTAIDRAMVAMSQVMPTIGCFRELVNKLLGAASKTVGKKVSRGFSWTLAKIKPFFDSFISGTAPKVVEFLFREILDTLANTMLRDGSIARVKQMLGLGIQKIIDTKERAATAALVHLHKMPHGNARDDLESKLGTLLKGKLDLSSMLPLAIATIEESINEVVLKQLEKLIPRAFNAVVNVAGGWLMGMATFGMNVAASTGSVLTEWVSTGILSLVQELWGQAVTHGQKVLMQKVKTTVSMLVRNKITSVMKSAADNKKFSRFVKGLFMQTMPGNLQKAKKDTRICTQVSHLLVDHQTGSPALTNGKGKGKGKGGATAASAPASTKDKAEEAKEATKDKQDKEDVDAAKKADNVAHKVKAEEAKGKGTSDVPAPASTKGSGKAASTKGNGKGASDALAPA